MARITQDNRGNRQMVIGAKRKTRQSGKESFPRGFFEVGSKLFKVEVGPANKDGVDHWLIVTELKKDGGSRNFNGGGGGGGGGGGRGGF